MAMFCLHATISETKDGFVIGTGSLRRKLFAEKIYPNAKFKDIRGNVDTRLKKAVER